MKKQNSIIIVSIISFASLFGVVYGTSVSDTVTTITGNLVVTGSCTGCGGGSIQTYTVTNTDLVGSTVLEVDNFTNISGQAISNSTYDGQVDFQIHKQDGSWTGIGSLSGTSTTVNFLGSQYGTGNSILVSADLKYPYDLRFVINTQAANGNVTITMKGVS